MLTPLGGQNWTHEELIELARLETTCHGVDSRQFAFGNTDEGDPWCVIYNQRQQRAEVHVARIDRHYVVAVPVERRSRWTTTLGAAVDLALAWTAHSR
jgi:hypothetical protein